MNQTHPIGIDFGTTKTLASRWDERSQRPVPIRLGRSRDLLPTTLHIDENGKFVFGEDAEDCRLRDAVGYFRRFKRDLGTGATYTLRDGRKVTCIDLISAYLRHVRERIEEEALHGGRIGHAVITVPALYGLAAKGDLKAAVTAAGFDDFSLLEEPVAGGASFLYDNASSFEGRNFLVFDWGGGTLDLAVVKKQGDVPKCHPDFIGGDPNLGGEDIDDAFAAMISNTIKLGGFAPLDEQSEEYRVVALQSLCDGKILLSRRDSHKFYFRLSEGPIEVECSRRQFEGVILEYVESALMQLRQIMAKAETAAVRLDGILLIGGSSEIPLVSRRILEMTGIRPLRWDYGKDAVALGAALVAHRRLFSIRNSVEKGAQKAKSNVQAPKYDWEVFNERYAQTEKAKPTAVVSPLPTSPIAVSVPVQPIVSNSTAGKPSAGGEDAAQGCAGLVVMAIVIYTIFEWFKGCMHSG